MATKQQAMAAVKAFNGSIDWRNSDITRLDKYIIIDAPDGYIWDASGADVIVINWYCGPAAEFYDQVIDDVLCGLSVKDYED
jgi:hypothetical protein